MKPCPDTPRPHQQPSPRRLFAVAAAAAVVGFILTLSFGFADHAPAPHGVRVAVAAPAGLVQGLATGLAHAAPGGFAVVAAPSARAVINAVRSQSAAGGLVTGATGPVTIVTAGAAGVEPAAGDHEGAHGRRDRAPPPGPIPRRRAAARQ